MKCELVICAESAIRDVDSNLLSLINVVEDLSVPTVPGFVAQLACVFMLRREPGDEAQTEASVVFTLNGEEILRGPVSVRFNGSSRFRQLLTVKGLFVPGPGILRVELRLGEVALGGWDIEVVSARQPQLELPLDPGARPAVKAGVKRSQEGENERRRPARKRPAR